MNKIFIITILILSFTITDAFSQLRSDLSAPADSAEISHSQLVQSLLESRHTQLNTLDRVMTSPVTTPAESSPAARSFTSRLGLNLTRDFLDNRYDNELFRNFRPQTVTDYNRFILHDNSSPYSRFIDFDNRSGSLSLPVLDN